MASTAGFQLVAGRIPGERIATDIQTSAGSGFTTTETTIHSVTAPLVSGRTYSITLIVSVISTVAGDNVDVIIREDTVITGTRLTGGRVDVLATNIGSVVLLYVQYTAVATGDKTFVAGALRTTGTGTITRNAGATTPSHMFVDYVSG